MDEKGYGESFMKKRLLIMGIVSVLALSVTACGGETLTEYQKNNTAEVSANAKCLQKPDGISSP